MRRGVISAPMPEWDTIFREKGYIFSEPHPEMERIAKLFVSRNVQRVLDLGCGTGRHMVFFSEKGFQMYGLDASEHALQLAKLWLDKSSLQGELRQHKMECRFPYDDDFFDAVISIQVIHHNKISDIMYTIREIERVLRKGGIAFVSVAVLKEERLFPDSDWALSEIEPGTYIPQKGPESGILHHYFTPDELRSAFSGFDILEMFIDSTNHRCLLGIKK